MADLIDKLHADAGLDLLAADDGLTVYDGHVPTVLDPATSQPVTAPPPYVLVYTSVSWPGRDTGVANALDGLAVTVTVDWIVHCVAETGAAARALAMRVRAALLNRRPTIAGRNCGLIVLDDVQAPQRDETTGRLVMDQVVTYSMTSVPG